jgi:hypothetical protein
VIEIDGKKGKTQRGISKKADGIGGLLPMGGKGVPPRGSLNGLGGSGKTPGKRKSQFAGKE